MLTIAQLEEKRDAALAAAKKIVDTASAENDGQGRSLTKDEKAAYDKHLAEVRDFKDRIELQKTVDAEERSIGQRQTRPIAPQNPQDDLKEDKPKLPAVASKWAGQTRCFKDDQQAYGFMASVISGPLRHFRDINPAMLKRCDEYCKRMGMDWREQRAMSEGVNSAGGYTVWTEFVPQIIQNVEQYGVARTICDVVPMGSDKQFWPKHNSGFTTYYPGEGSEITASQPVLEGVQLDAKKLAVLTVISSELSEDTMVALGDYLGDRAAQAIAQAEDNALFNGDGTSTYGGIRGILTKTVDGNYEGSVYNPGTSDASIADLTLGDLELVAGQLPQYAAANAVWVFSRAHWFAGPQRLMDAAGGTTKSDIAGAPAFQLFGYPVVLSQVLSGTLGDYAAATGIFAFGDFRRGVIFGDRRAITMSMTGDRYWELDQIGIKWTSRYDINVHGPVVSSSEAGPFIVYETVVP